MYLCNQEGFTAILHTRPFFNETAVLYTHNDVVLVLMSEQEQAG